MLLDLITFSFHYPRLTIMFRAPLPQDPAPLRRAAREWTLGNHVRLVLLVIAFLAALHAYSQLPMHRERLTCVGLRPRALIFRPRQKEAA